MNIPTLEYLPCDPTTYGPAIGLIGCGAITKEHLEAYRAAEYKVAALCDIDREAAENRRKEFFPDAIVTTDAAALLAMHEAQRAAIAELDLPPWEQSSAAPHFS